MIPPSGWPTVVLFIVRRRRATNPFYDLKVASRLGMAYPTTLALITALWTGAMRTRGDAR